MKRLTKAAIVGKHSWTLEVAGLFDAQNARSVSAQHFFEMAGGRLWRYAALRERLFWLDHAYASNVSHARVSIPSNLPVHKLAVSLSALVPAEFHAEVRVLSGVFNSVSEQRLRSLNVEADLSVPKLQAYAESILANEPNPPLFARLLPTGAPDVSHVTTDVRTDLEETLATYATTRTVRAAHKYAFALVRAILLPSLLRSAVCEALVPLPSFEPPPVDNVYTAGARMQNAMACMREEADAISDIRTPYDSTDSLFMSPETLRMIRADRVEAMEILRLVRRLVRTAQLEEFLRRSISDYVTGKVAATGTDSTSSAAGDAQPEPSAANVKSQGADPRKTRGKRSQQRLVTDGVVDEVSVRKAVGARLKASSEAPPRARRSTKRVQSDEGDRLSPAPAAPAT